MFCLESARRALLKGTLPVIAEWQHVRSVGASFLFSSGSEMQSIPPLASSPFVVVRLPSPPQKEKEKLPEEIQLDNFTPPVFPAVHISIPAALHLTGRFFCEAGWLGGSDCRLLKALAFKLDGPEASGIRVWDLPVSEFGAKTCSFYNERNATRDVGETRELHAGYLIIKDSS